MISARKIIILIIIFQLAVIGSLILYINKLKSPVLGESISINPQNKEDYLFNQQYGYLKFFYEPKPNSTRTDQVLNSSQTVTYKFNSESLNENREYQEKASDVYRIISLGDSYTFGLFVDPSQNYTKQLESLLNQGIVCSSKKRFEVINLGVPGYDIQYTLERFKRRGQKLNPDLVIWIMKHDDFFQINELVEERSEQIHKELLQSGEQQQLEKQGKFYEYKVRATQELLTKIGVETILDSQVSQLQKFSDYYSGRLLIFALPDGRDLFEKYLNKFVSVREDTFYFDHFPSFSKDQMFADGHPNILGHKFIAGNLFEYIKQNQVIPCE